MHSGSRVRGLIGSVITITTVVVVAYLLAQIPSRSEVYSILDSDNLSFRSAENPDDKYPSTLKIPRIDVEASVQHVGKAASGDMDVPSNYSDVGWYKYGTLPGAKGTAVIDGHLDDRLGLPAVFADLSEVAIGDEVIVVTRGGKTLTFIVRRTDIYHYNDPDAPQAIFGDSSKPTLKLITCGGKWLKNERIYEERLVVTAELKS